jgi:hypothetical protein
MEFLTLLSGSHDQRDSLNLIDSTEGGFIYLFIFQIYQSKFFSCCLILSLFRLFFIARVADMRKHVFVEAHVTVFLYTQTPGTEDVVTIPVNFSPSNYIPLIVPHVFLHRLDETSPILEVLTDGTRKAELVVSGF